MRVLWNEGDRWYIDIERRLLGKTKLTKMAFTAIWRKTLLNFWLKLNGINLNLRKTYSSHGILEGIMYCHGIFLQLFWPVYIILIIHHKNSNYHVCNLQWLFVHYFQCDVNLSRSNDKGVMPLITNSFVDILVVLLLWNYLEITQQSTKYC